MGRSENIKCKTDIFLYLPFEIIKICNFLIAPLRHLIYQLTQKNIFHYDLET